MDDITSMALPHTHQRSSSESVAEVFLTGKVIEQFGRYPSRNEALGRESTEEEKKHLESGPGW